MGVISTSSPEIWSWGNGKDIVVDSELKFLIPDWDWFCTAVQALLGLGLFVVLCHFILFRGILVSIFNSFLTFVEAQIWS